MLPVTFEQDKWRLLLQTIPASNLRQLGYTHTEAECNWLLIERVQASTLTPITTFHITRVRHNSQGWCVSNFWHGCITTQTSHIGQQQVSVYTWSQDAAWHSHGSLTSALSPACCCCCWCRCCSQTCLCYSELSIRERRPAKHGGWRRTREGSAA